MSTSPQIKASVKLQAKIRKVHLTVRQMVFADLLAIGYEPRDAYQISGIFDPILSLPENWKNMRILMETNEAFNNYIPAFKANTEPIQKPTKKKTQEPEEELVKVVPPTQSESPVPSPHEISDEEMSEMLSKEHQLKELLWKLKHEDLDTKTEIEIRKMVADLTNVKKEQTQVEEKRTTFVLPLKCFQCSLYNEAKRKANEAKHKKK